MDQEFHAYNEGRDEMAFSHAQSRTPGYANQDARRVHNYDETDHMQDSISTDRWQESTRGRDMRQEQMIRSRRMKAMATEDAAVPGYHSYNEGRDERAFSQVQKRTPQNTNYDPRHVHDDGDEEDYKQDSVDAFAWQESTRGRDMRQDQFIRARHLRQKMN